MEQFLNNFRKFNHGHNGRKELAVVVLALGKVVLVPIAREQSGSVKVLNVR